MPAPLKPLQTNIKQDAANPDVKGQSLKKQAAQAASQAAKAKKEPSQPQPDIKPDDKAPLKPPLKKLPRRSSKPIIDWFHRKLTGSVRARRVSETDTMRNPRHGARSPSIKEKPHRVSTTLTTRARSKTETKQGQKIATVTSIPPRKPVSLDGISGGDNHTEYTADSDDGRRSSFARSSLWSPTSHYEADEDASVRPLPPSSPPSPSPSRSSSSYLSDPRTFRSMTASTKPTTVLSMDMTGGMAHIAQAPPTPTIPARRLHPHIRTHSIGPGSGASITFSTVQPPSPTAASRPSSSGALANPPRTGQPGLTYQAPQHTSHHPRNNPRPSSPPQDDASVLTLASSAFGIAGARIGVAALSLSGRASLADDSISHFSHLAGHGDSTSHFLLGEMDDDRLERDLERDDQDVDASVRALRPRSSRRCSWESSDSKWSASASLALTGMTSQSPVSHGGPRSLWTSGSYRTGGVSVEHGELGVDHSDETDGNGDNTEDGDETSLDEREGPYSDQMHGSPSSAPTHSTNESVVDEQTSSSSDDARTPPATPFDHDGISLEVPTLEPQHSGSITSSKSTTATPKGGPIPLHEHDAMPAIPPTPKRRSTSDSASDMHSLATSDYHTDAFHTPATTPVPQ